MTTMLSIEQKQQLYREGYVILKGAVSKELTSAVRAAIEEGERNPEPIPADDPIYRGTLYHMPHTSTRNERGTESRKSGDSYQLFAMIAQDEKIGIQTGIQKELDRGELVGEIRFA